jgi:hypothetical protein
MFGSSSAQEPNTAKDSIPKGQQSFENENVSKNASPLRSRLESPAAKFARFGCSPKNLSSSAVTELPPKNDAVISNLKERLARLKQQ